MMTTNVEHPAQSILKRPDSLPALLRAIKETSSGNVKVPDDIDDPNSTSFGQLLSLTTQSLDDLRTQPAALHTASSSLESQLSNLCSRHVSSFVRVHSASSALPRTLDRLDVQLNELIDHDLQTLSEAAQQFPKNVESSLIARNKARNLLDQYETSLKDLLDIPRLLMTCAKANHPIEALQLGIHMAKIAHKDAESGQNSITVKALKEECWVYLIKLREDLLRGLGARGVRLPAARRYVSLLQRLHDIDETYRDRVREGNSDTSRLAISQSAICLSFLRSRWIMIEDLGAHDSDEQVATILSSQISSWRDLVGDTCNIAMTLFGDKGSQDDTGKSDSVDTADEPSPLSLISSFGYRSISKLEQLVSRVLPSIDGKEGSLQDAFEMLASLHMQLSYSAASLSRQGLDFSDVSGAGKAFESQSLELWSSGIKMGLELFENSLGSSAILAVKDLTGSEDVGEVLKDITLENIRISEDWSLQVSYFPPLTKLANDILDLHDAFVSFAPLSIGKDALKVFDFAMTDLLAHMLESFRKAESDQTATSSSIQLPPLTAGMQNMKDSQIKKRSHEATIAVTARFLATLSDVLLPFLRKCTSSLFEREFQLAPSLDSTLRSITDWTNEIEQKWQTGEVLRSNELKKAEDDRIAAAEAERNRMEEEKRMRQEAERRERLAEENRLREERERNKREEEERNKREEEERIRKEEAEKERIEADRLRKEEEKRQLEEERLRKEEQEKRLSDEREMKRIEDEKNKAKEVEARKREDEAKRKEEEEEAKKLAEENEERKKRDEEAKQREEERKRQVLEDEKKRQAEEDEKMRLAEEEQKKAAEEEGRRLQDDENRKKRDASGKQEEEAELKKGEELRNEEEQMQDLLDDSKQPQENEAKTSATVSEDEEESKEKGTTDTSAKDKKKKKKNKKKKGSKTPDTAQMENLDTVPVSDIATEVKTSNTPEQTLAAASGEKNADDVVVEEKSAVSAISKTEGNAENKDSEAGTEQEDADGTRASKGESEEPVKQPVKSNNKLAERLRKRQEERAAAAAASMENLDVSTSL